MSGIIHTGYDNNSRYYMRWWLVGQEIENNRSLVGWEIGLQGVAGHTAYWYSNALRINSGYVDGAHVCGSQTYSNITLQGDGLRGLRGGSLWIGHNADGAKAFGMSVSGWFYGAGDRNASGSWNLPTIPRNSQVSTNAVSYTLGDPITINTNRKSTAFTHTITINLHNSGGTEIQRFNSVADAVTWTPDAGQITAMQNAIPNSNTLNLYIYQHNNQVNAGSAVDRTLTLTNANPTFDDFEFEDTDAATVAITGNDQVLVKGQSVLGVTVPSAEKMIALKGSTPVRYDFTYDGVSNQGSYSTSDVSTSFSTISTIGTRTIEVTAFDSRTNSTRVAKDITVYDYVAPTITSTLERENNFDSDTTINIEGTYTPLVIGGVNKNALTTGTLQYRYKEDGGAFGSWTTRTFTPNTTAGTYTITPFVLSLDNTKKYIFEFHIDDEFGTVTTTAMVDIGIPIVFIGEKDGIPTLEVGGNPVLPSHIGMVITSTTLSTSTDVEEIYAGTWEPFGEGRVVVGKAASGTFGTAGATGGAETHTHSLSNNGFAKIVGVGSSLFMERATPKNFTSNHFQGGFTSAANQNDAQTYAPGLSGATDDGSSLPPHVVAYMWERTA